MNALVSQPLALALSIPFIGNRHQHAHTHTRHIKNMLNYLLFEIPLIIHLFVHNYIKMYAISCMVLLTHTNFRFSSLSAFFLSLSRSRYFVSSSLTIFSSIVLILLMLNLHVIFISLLQIRKLFSLCSLCLAHFACVRMSEFKG